MQSSGFKLLTLAVMTTIMVCLCHASEKDAIKQVSKIDEKIAAIENFLSDHFDSHNFTESDAFDYVSNPINTYMLIKRTSVYWPHLLETLFEDHLSGNFKKTVMRSMWVMLFLVILIRNGSSTYINKENVEEYSRDLFSSAAEVGKLYRLEIKIRKKLEELLRNSSSLSEKATEAIKTYNENSKSGYEYSHPENEYENYIHPVNSFNMLKRSTFGLRNIKKLLENSSVDLDLFKDLPNPLEVEGAANGLFLLHETYQLNLSKFAMGEIEVPGSEDRRVIKGGEEIFYVDLEQLGKLAFNRGFYDRAIEWMEVAVERAKATSVGDKEIKRLEDVTSVMKEKHDQVLDRKGPGGDKWRTFLLPFDEKLRKKKKYKKIKNKRAKVDLHLLDYHEMDYRTLWESFNALCRGERVRKPDDDKDIKCSYYHLNDPFLRLGPFKLEPKSLQPFIAVFHDFISDNEANAIRTYASEKLYRSLHLSDKGKPNSASVTRTSAQAWLDELEQRENGHPEAYQLSRRISWASRMETYASRGSESFQVANYGIGGVYNHHTDSSGEAYILKGLDYHLDEMGDRLVTAMGYLTDVLAGGATVFPAAGVTIWPKKGNLAFWYNNDFNGNLDKKTYHGGCPVLAGSKWITNKWIRSLAQWHLFPCTLSNQRYNYVPPLENDGFLSLATNQL